MSLLNSLKNQTSDLQKVNGWLDRIGETDKSCRDEVINQCRTDKKAMDYYLSRYAENEVK